MTPSYEYQATCPNDQNLIYVQGRAVEGDPLAEPGVVGVSSGAALAAATVIVTGWTFAGSWTIALAAFVGGLLLWHLLGDPSMEIRSAEPVAFDTTKVTTKFVHRTDTFPVGDQSGSFAGSALFAYQINWQTVLFLGLADNEVYTAATDQLEDTDRSVFVKVSYAFQG